VKAVVVGAGAAGLAATYRLRKGGVEVTALEERERAGGRLAGAARDGFILDLGAQFFFRFFDTTFSLCRELGLAEQVVPFPFKAGTWREGRLHPLTVGLDPRPLWRDRRDLLRFRLLTPRGAWQAARLLSLMVRRRRDLHFVDYGNALDLDGESLAELVLRRGGGEALEFFFQPLASTLTLGEPEEVGAAYGMALAWYALHGLFTLREGMGSLADGLSRECGDSLLLSTPARRIVIESKAVRGVETGAGFLDADVVICATTASRALRLLPDLPEEMRKVLRGVRYSSCCHAMFGLPRRLLPEGWYAVALPRAARSPLSGFTDNSIKSCRYAPPGAGMLHCFTYGKHARELNAARDEEVLALLLDEVRRYAPSPPADPVFGEIRRWEEAVCLSPPGMLRQVTRLKRESREEIRGLYLAGEYLFMPSVEGALRSGMDAAETAMRA